MATKTRSTSFRILSASCGLVLLIVGGAAPSGAEDRRAVSSSPASHGSFEAQWSVKGTREELSFGSVGSQAIFKHQGRLTVLRSNGLVGSAFSSCIGLSDTRTGSSGRCVWVTDGGDEIFSEVNRVPSPAGQGGKGVGRLVGGTGRFAGIEGSYEMRWIERPQADSADLAHETISMSGRWKIAHPAKPSGTR